MTTSSRPAFDYTLTSLRNGEQCVEIPLVCHQLIKVTAFLHCAVLYSQDTIIPMQQCLLQHMCNDYAGHTGQVEEVGRTRFPIPPARPAAAFPARLF